MSLHRSPLALALVLGSLFAGAVVLNLAGHRWSLRPEGNDDDEVVKVQVMNLN